MPKLDLEMFEDEPSVGDKVKVMGEVKSINDDGTVEVSYDDVSVVDKDLKSEEDIETEDDSDSQDLDSALDKAFNKGQ